MLTLPPSVKVYLARASVDMRQGHDGLTAIIRQWGLEPYSGHIFVFLGKRLDRAKLLYWDRSGFVLLYKRLERGRFRPPPVTDTATQVQIESVQLMLLLEGIDFSRVKSPKRWQPPSISRPIDKPASV